MSEPKSLYLLPDPGLLVRKLEAQGWRVAALTDPVSSQGELIDALAQVLALPDYLGRGYDALFDALTDEAALGGVPQLLLVLEDWRGFATADASGFLRFVELVLDAGRRWRGRGGDMRICLRD